MKQTKNNSKKSKVSIKWRLFAYLVAFTAVILVLLWLCQVVFLDNIYSYFKIKEITRSGERIEESISGKTILQSELSNAAEALAVKNNVCILIAQMLNSNQALSIVSSDILSNCTIHTMNDNGLFTLYNAAKSQNGRALKYYRYDESAKKFYSIPSAVFYEGDDEVSMIYSVITSDAEGHDILILLNSVVSPVGATVQTLNMILIAVSAVMIILALVLAFVLSYKISDPIIKINDSAKLLAQNNYNVHFASGGYREISELSDTLNYASSELSKVDALRRELIANISHDLRTPLTMIRGYSEVMRDIPGENTPENIQVIIDETNRLTSLVNDMLDISKLESGNITVNNELIDLTALISSSMERYKKLKEQDGYNIEFISNGIDVFVNTDRTIFLQAFYNLVNNAVTHTGKDKKIAVMQNVITQGKDASEKVIISVTDTGDGIEADKLPLIWERYYKIDKTHKRAAIGTGLGLSIVKNAMRLLCGDCDVESVLGKGSTFKLILPVVSVRLSDNRTNFEGCTDDHNIFDDTVSNSFIKNDDIDDIDGINGDICD